MGGVQVVKQNKALLGASIPKEPTAGEHEARDKSRDMPENQQVDEWHADASTAILSIPFVVANEESSRSRKSGYWKR